MFDFIKKKLKESINSIQHRLAKEEQDEQKEVETKEFREQVDEIKQEKQIIEGKPEKKAAEKSHAEEKHKNNADKHEERPGTKKEIKNAKEHAPEKKKRILSHKITSEDIASIYGDIKEALLENNVAMEVAMAIHKDLEESLIGKEVSFLSNKKEVETAIKKSISDVMFEYSSDRFLSDIRRKKPYIILFIGVNGAGKTTTLAKLINFLQKNNLRVVVSASDTFRAASIEQVEIHTKKLGAKLIKHNYGADPAAVAFDAIKHAHSENADVVMIDTAGRSDINKNLIEELKKVKRVSKPDLTIFIGDALTGNDAVNQARIFDKEVGIDTVILSKADVDKKGGAILSISYVTKKPILFLGTGQGYEDLVPFSKERTAEFILS